MRRYFGIILAVVIVLAVLIGLAAVEQLSGNRPPESEADPLRSGYNPGPTGTRAFYQLLEESGHQVARWRESYSALEGQAKGATLVVVGPFQTRQDLPPDEAKALQSWVAAGGQALIVSRTPRAQFGDPAISAKTQAVAWNVDPDRLVDEKSDVLIAQPTQLTRDIRGLAVSRLAARMTFLPPPAEAQKSEADQERGGDQARGEDQTSEDDEDKEAEQKVRLKAPVVHLGDGDGAVLADFDYGLGRVIFLSDPFVIANGGIGRGANLRLALNLVEALGGRHRRLFFDEYHHGYRSGSNPLVNYFRGTPAPWLLGQGLLLASLILYSFGRRFARPLPLPQVDRHSPLEFVGSMANLQQVAQARDLAIENIYPRFKARLCRALGISGRARPEEIAAHLSRRHPNVPEAELRQVLSESERTLAGASLDDHRLIALVSAMRRISARFR